MPKRSSVPWYRKPFDPQFMSKEELAKKIEKSYKKANDRLKSIEKAGLTKASNAYRYIERESYDNAEYLTKKGRFKKPNKKMSRNELLSEYVNLNRFLNESKTSTVKGTKDRYKKAYNTYAKKIKQAGGKPMSFEEYGDFWRSTKINKLLEQFGGSDLMNFLSERELSLNDLENIIAFLPDEDVTLFDLENAIDEYKSITI